MDRQTDAIRELTAELRAAQERVSADLKSTLETLQPAVTAIAELGSAQKRLCDWVKKHRVKITLGLLAALTAIGAISPTAADALKAVLMGIGG